LNPAVSGQAVTFTAQVSPSAATGSVQFKDGATLLGTVTATSGAASLVVSSLSVGTHSVTAVYSGDGNYNGSTSAALAQTVTAAIPGAPTNLTATATSSSQINLAWTASPTGGVTYNVYSSTTSGFTPAAGNRIATGVTANSYSQTGLAPSTVHYYKVTAQNSAGESASSNQAGATTLAAGVTCQVVYTVTTQWNVGFGTAITIKNTGSTQINGWNLTWKWAGNQQITQSWNSSYTQNGKNASLTNLSWNPTIAPGATLSGMGFNASYSGTNTAPTAFYVNGTLCQ
jgi:cellulose 1,4-beta-cellobiosidase